MNFHVTITDSGWIANLPKLERPVRIRQVMDLAGKLATDVRVAGQHWDSPKGQ